MMLPRLPQSLAASVAVCCLALGAASEASAQDTLARAKDLYVTAAYDEALVLLDRLHQSAPAEDATEIAGYQVFCLLALGRTDDANRAIEALVKSDPLYRPSEATASPRTRAAFDDVRKGLLPKIVQELYDNAKASYDNKDPQAAVAQFDRVIQILNEPGLADQPAMVDLRRLASGFRDLSHSAAELAAAAAAASAPKPPSPPPLPPPPTYTATDTAVTPPSVVSRTIPPWRPWSAVEARREHTGIIEVVVDEKGDVASVAVVKSILPEYDQMLLKAAPLWKFKPATKDGAAVRYRTTMEIKLRPSGT
jgi:TonB family protein